MSTLTDADIVEIRDEMLPSQGEPFDIIAFARAIEQRLVNTPELADFARGVVLEALHQRQRWGSAHDAGKTPADWFWLLGYLGGKTLHQACEVDRLRELPDPSTEALIALGEHAEKALHHTITAAAALANWHAAIAGVDSSMRPGIEPPTELNPTHSTVPQLLARAALDSDPISVFQDGTCEADSDTAIFVVKGKAHVDYVKGMAERQRLLTPSKPVVDGEASQ